MLLMDIYRSRAKELSPSMLNSRWVLAWVFLVVVTLFWGPFTHVAKGQYAPGEDLYYTIQRDVAVFDDKDMTSSSFNLNFREPVYVIERSARWTRIQTDTGAEGYVTSEALSNVWIRVSKRQKSVYIYRGTELVRQIPADFGNNVSSDKIQRGDQRSPDDWRTPEGSFFVVSKNPNSKFYKALVLNYPTAEDARRGFKQGLISKDEYDTIVEAEASFKMPPMNTMLGGWIEIHGDGTGGGTNWTQGCIAIENERMDEIWDMIEVGTPVLTEY